MPDLAPVYAALHAVMSPYAAKLDAKRDDAQELYVDTRQVQKNGKPLFFGAVQVKKGYVAYHLMPVYVKPELLASISPELKARMHGKSCFNFKAEEPALFEELAALTEVGWASYREQGYVQGRGADAGVIMQAKERMQLLDTLEARFVRHAARHAGIAWKAVGAKLEKHPAALAALAAMEASGGEPDVIGRDESTGAFLYCDCSAESPAGRRSLCYDGEALRKRKENKPAGSAMETAAAMGAELLDEAQYRALQQLGEFDLKTSSWVATPADVRERGGALFCDRRYGRVFTYHNGAESYYAARGFRALVRV